MKSGMNSVGLFPCTTGKTRICPKGKHEGHDGKPKKSSAFNTWVWNLSRVRVGISVLTRNPQASRFYFVFSSPPRQYPAPVWIHMLAHLGFIIALAVSTLFVSVSAARKLILIQFDTQPGFLGNVHATMHNRNPPA